MLTRQEFDQIKTAISMAASYDINKDRFVSAHNIVCLLARYVEGYEETRNDPAAKEEKRA